MIGTILKRRFWIIKNRLFYTIGLLLLLPLFLNIIINLPLKRMAVSSLSSAPHEQWIYPGLVIIVVFIMMIPTVYRDLFDLRLHKKLLPSLSLTPISKPIYLYNVLLAVIIESVVYAILVMCIFTLIMIPGYGIIEYLIMFPFIILFIALGANILITLSLIANKPTLYNIIMLTFFIFIIFGSGLIFEFEFFPNIIGDILGYLPTGQIMLSLRMAMLSGVVNWIIVASALVTIIVWAYINGILFKKRLLQ